MSYQRMKKRELELKAEVARMLAAAEAADAQEDETFGKDKRGDEMPDWAGDKAKRLAKIQEAMAALEADAKLAAEEERRIEAEKEKQRDAEGRKKPGKPAAPPSDEPDPKAQRNFTDPESRIMKSKDGFVQAYNAQAAVDADAQIIVAHELTQCGSDQGQLVPLVAAIENNLGRKPEQASADSGYCSEANLEALVARGIDGYVAPGRAKHPTAANGKVGGPLTQLMRKKIDDGGFETPYRLRKQVVEPVFGQIKQARGFRQFLLRGVEKVRAEWAMICTAHNLVKLFTLGKGRLSRRPRQMPGRDAYLDGLLDLALFVDAQHQRLVRRIEIEPDHVRDLGGEVLVARHLERLDLMRLQSMRSPNALGRCWATGRPPPPGGARSSGSRSAASHAASYAPPD